jgi:hypothetical protein
VARFESTNRKVRTMIKELLVAILLLAASVPAAAAEVDAVSPEYANSAYICPSDAPLACGGSMYGNEFHPDGCCPRDYPYGADEPYFARRMVGTCYQTAEAARSHCNTDDPQRCTVLTCRR